jgi:drug/metabolite transporter (DMT)-like permease
MNIWKIPALEKDGTFWWGMFVRLLFAGEFILICRGLEYTNASRGIIFLYLSLFVVAIGAQLFIPGEHLVSIQVVGLCCAFTGIVIAFSESFRCPTPRMLIGDSMLTGVIMHQIIEETISPFNHFIKTRKERGLNISCMIRFSPILQFIY